ncbi:MAG: TlpA family protein disulfide reductase [Deltaproteobacteria bacterium]|jgi:thiol-disulfide isomerase/thioredoxin|nr:TlpA family protein disulfide reductase [Deltaproteobacteria bacterium]
MTAPIEAGEGPTKLDRRSGYALTFLMLAAFGVAGLQLYQIASGPPPPRPGTMAPSLAARGLDGRELSLGALSGQVVLVDFWATWCPPCRAAMPTLQQVHQEYGPKGFTVLGVNIEPGLESTVKAFMQKERLTFPSLVDEGPLAPAWGVYSYPTSFLIGRDGAIRTMYRGPASPGRLRSDIEAALAGTPPAI